MRRGQNKRAERFEMQCDQVRLQLLYLDEVNYTGHELTKLQHETETADGQRKVLQKKQMKDYAQENGFWFYMDADEYQKVRINPFQGHATADEAVGKSQELEQVILTKNESILLAKYDSPDLMRAFAQNRNLSRQHIKWKQNILKLIDTNIAPKSPGVSPRKSPQRRVQSCSSITKMDAREKKKRISQDAVNQDDPAQAVITNVIKSKQRNSPQIRAKPIELRQLSIYLTDQDQQVLAHQDDEEEYNSVELPEEEKEKIWDSPQRSMQASCSQSSSPSPVDHKYLTRVKKCAHSNVSSTALVTRHNSIQIDTLQVRSIKDKKRAYKEPNSACKLFNQKASGADSSASGSVGIQKKPSLLQPQSQKSLPKHKVSTSSKRNLLSMYADEQSSNKSDSGGSDDAMQNAYEIQQLRIANLHSLSRMGIGERKLNKLADKRPSNQSVAQRPKACERAKTCEGFEQLKKNQSVVINGNVNILPRPAMDKQQTITKPRISDQQQQSFANWIKRSNTSIYGSQLLQRLKLQHIESTTSNDHMATPKMMQSGSLMNRKIKELRESLEMPGLTREQLEQEKESIRRKTLFRHARMLINIADGVTDYFNDEFGKKEGWLEKFGQVVDQHQLLMEGHSSDSEEDSSSRANSVSIEIAGPNDQDLVSLSPTEEFQTRDEILQDSSIEDHQIREEESQFEATEAQKSQRDCLDFGNKPPVLNNALRERSQSFSITDSKDFEEEKAKISKQNRKGSVQVNLPMTSFSKFMRKPISKTQHGYELDNQATILEESPQSNNQTARGSTTFGQAAAFQDRKSSISPGQELIMGCRENSHKINEEINRSKDVPPLAHRSSLPVVKLGAGFSIKLNQTDLRQASEEEKKMGMKKTGTLPPKKSNLNRMLTNEQLLDDLEAELNDEDPQLDIGVKLVNRSQQVIKVEKLPPFLKGQSHALPGSRHRKSEKKTRRANLKKLSPSPLKGAGTASNLDKFEVKLMPTDMTEFYKDLSSSDSSISDHLCKLKNLFKHSNLGQQYSRPGSPQDGHHEHLSHSQVKLSRNGGGPKRGIKILLCDQKHSSQRDMYRSHSPKPARPNHSACSVGGVEDGTRSQQPQMFNTTQNPGARGAGSLSQFSLNRLLVIPPRNGQGSPLNHLSNMSPVNLRRADGSARTNKETHGGFNTKDSQQQQGVINEAAQGFQSN